MLITGWAIPAARHEYHYTQLAATFAWTCWAPAGGKLQEVHISEDKAGSWRVEEEFIAAIRGTEKVQRTTFAAGVRYMEFTQAVAMSYQMGKAVSLPLTAV